MHLNTAQRILLFRLVLRKQGEAIRLAVIDQGEGVAEEDQDLVFKRFFRTASARANTQQGSGLGLSHSKKFSL